MAEGLRDYTSPYLRKAVFDRMHPGSQVTYDVMPIDDAFPGGHYADDGGQATEAVVCTIVMPDGTWVQGVKEINTRDKRYGKWVDIPQTAEQYQKDCTKAMGRALRDAGIPMNINDLRSLMTWIVALDGKQPAAVTKYVERGTGEIVGSDDPDGDDEHPDAGVEPTAEQRVAAKVRDLIPEQKIEVQSKAKELGVTNIMRAGDLAEQLEAFIDSMTS